MAFTYVPSTDVGKVRLLIFDAKDPLHVYEDEEIQVFLALEGGRIKRAAALALEGMASNEAFTTKAIRLLDLGTDGPKVADSLIKRAQALREQDAADLLLEQAAAGDAGFEIAEWGLGPASLRDYLHRQGPWEW